jgi:hypothetical protein
LPSPTSLATLLANPRESTSVDFKLRFGWDTRGGQIELARDIVCLANRNGGWLVAGVRDLGGGRFELVGLAEDDVIPDPTDLLKTVRKYFDPVPEIEVFEEEVDGRRFAVVSVSEFKRVPIFCTAIGNDERGNAVVRPGYIYRRSDELDCSPLVKPSAFQEVIEATIGKTGAAIRGMLDAEPQATAAERPSPPTPPEHQSHLADTLRICNLYPVERPQPVAILDLGEKVSEAAIRGRGGVYFPRMIDPRTMPPSAIVREPTRIIVERVRDERWTAFTGSLIEVTTDLHVRVREELWEAEGQLNFSTTFGFVFQALAFARRFYEGTAVKEVDLAIGVTAALGRQLTDDPGRFSGFHQTYVATTPGDLVATRRVAIASLEKFEDRKALARSLTTELFGYFGFRMNDDAFEAHVKYVAELFPDVV